MKSIAVPVPLDSGTSAPQYKSNPKYRENLHTLVCSRKGDLGKDI